jgi:anti-sigma-K factor RskA
MSEKMEPMQDQGDAYELDELLGAYALDAVDPHERRRVDDYLEVNPRAAAEVQAHREVATMLAFTGMDAPNDLWDRIAAELDGPPPAPGPELAKVLALDDHARDRRTRNRNRVGKVLPWVASAVAAAVIAIVAVNVVRPDSTPSDPIAAAVDHAAADRDSQTTILTSPGSKATAKAMIDQDGHGFLLASDLPTLPADQTYQLWGVMTDGQVISLGILGANPEVETFSIDSPVTALAVTIEKMPGVIANGNPNGAFTGTF